MKRRNLLIAGLAAPFSPALAAAGQGEPRGESLPRVSILEELRKADRKLTEAARMVVGHGGKIPGGFVALE